MKQGRNTAGTLTITGGDTARTGRYVSQAEKAAVRAEQSAAVAEAWAVGEKGGAPVGSTDETFHNNARHFAEQAAASVTFAQAARTAAESAKDDAEAAADSVTGSAAQIQSNKQDVHDLKSATGELYTLSELDNLHNEYSLPSVMYRRGGMSGGQPVYNRTNRIITPDIIKLDKPSYIGCVGSGFRVTVAWYKDDDSYDNAVILTDTQTVYVPANKGFRIAVSRITEDAGEIADLIEFASKVRMYKQPDYSIAPPFADYRIDAKISCINGKYFSGVNPYDFFVKKTNGVNVYISTNGSDDNDGLTPDTPKLTIESALNVANVETVFFKAGNYVNGTHFTNALVVNTPINFIGIGDAIITMGNVPGITFNDSVFCENIAFRRGNNSVITRHDSSKTAVFYKCIFRDTANYNGLNINGGNAYIFDCEAYGNTNDGFNYHNNGNNTPHVLEVNCYSHNNGLLGNSCNATSIHNNGRIVRINGNYKFSRGSVVADASESISANYGCNSGVSTITTEADADKMSNYWVSGGAKMYLFNCGSYGSRYDTAVYDTGEIITDRAYPRNYTP